MSDYVQRLIRCGYSPSEAYSTCYNFIKEFSIRDLQTFITCLEEEYNVDKV